VIGNYFFIAQWFPKISVLDAGGWNAHQFHAATGSSPTLVRTMCASRCPTAGRWRHRPRSVRDEP
jgi:hypothetical protein